MHFGKEGKEHLPTTGRRLSKEVLDPAALLQAFPFVGDLSDSHCPALCSPAALCTEGKEHLFSDVQRSANATPAPVVEIPGSIGGCSYLVGYTIGFGRFIESLADLVEALCMAEVYLYRLAICRRERSIASGESAAHMRVWRHSQKERRGA